MENEKLKMQKDFLLNVRVKLSRMNFNRST